MEHRIQMIKRIHTLAVVAAIFNAFSLLISIAACIENILLLSGVYQILVMIYIIVQIEHASNELMACPVLSLEIIAYIQKVGYACIASGMGTSLISTILNSIIKKEFYLVCNFTQIGIGLLLLAGAQVYRYGYERNGRWDATV